MNLNICLDLARLIVDVGNVFSIVIVNVMKFVTWVVARQILFEIGTQGPHAQDQTNIIVHPKVFQTLQIRNILIETQM